jgi:hypothetical protein
MLTILLDLVDRDVAIIAQKMGQGVFIGHGTINASPPEGFLLVAVGTT